ncbi:hypothetical protein LCGC14_2298230 [marine sediment metagenome]|uniref:Uncharacterized protein n=1 Tax=marine sediment metagenome TaxID=412755 RepID=A0A0F9CPP5_9ZZZZ
MVSHTLIPDRCDPLPLALHNAAAWKTPTLDTSSDLPYNGYKRTVAMIEGS